LRRGGVRAERFLPPRLVPPSLAINLRNHRKILVADGRVGFTGGMNLGDRHLATDTGNPARVVDTHFRLTGPVVAQLAEVFLADWAFVTGERTPPPEVPAAEAAAPERPPEPTGAVTRTLVDGPNEDLDKLLAVLVGAVSAAHHRVSVMTPYFLPPPSLASALEAAALRGVAVTVILPARNNLPYIQWATRHALPELLRRGVRVFYQPPPFVHTKLFEVDAHYAQIGSANLDPRSLRLNFELAVEVYDRTFAGGLAVVLDQARERSAEITLRQIEGRSLAVRGRDALAWLFSPYL
jgi:cardiolipin synthase